MISRSLLGRRDLAPLAATLNKELNGAPTMESTMIENAAVAPPKVPGIDLSFRPRSYFWPLGLETHLLARIKGAERKAALND